MISISFEKWVLNAILGLRFGAGWQTKRPDSDSQDADYRMIVRPCARRATARAAAVTLALLLPGRPVAAQSNVVSTGSVEAQAKANVGNVGQIDTQQSPTVSLSRLGVAFNRTASASADDPLLGTARSIAEVESSMAPTNGVSGHSLRYDWNYDEFFGSSNQAATSGAAFRFTSDLDGVIQAYGAKWNYGAGGFGGMFAELYAVDNQGRMTFIAGGFSATASTYNLDASISANRTYELDVGLTASELSSGLHGSGGTNGAFIWGISGFPLPGQDAAHPLLPTSVGPGNQMNITAVVRDPGSMVYVDPEYAAGYTYTSDADNFRSVLIPAALPGGDHSFLLTFGGTSYALEAGTTFDFTSVIAGGVDSFTITGIDVSEHLDPSDPRAFVTGLGFMSAGGSFVHMTPTQAVPEPSSLALFGLGLATAATLYRGRGGRRGRPKY